MGVTLIRILARLLLALYPPRARREIGDGFVGTALHRLEKERGRTASLRALLRTCAVLLSDTLRAAPREWGLSLAGARFVRDDLVLALRKLVRTPGFTVVAVLTLALTIGANAAILAIADAVLFRPLPYADADRLQVIEMRDDATGERYFRVRYAYLQAIDESHRGLGQVGMMEPAAALQIPTPDGGERVRIGVASVDYFDVVGVRAWRGRLFAPGDAPGRVAVLSHASWTQRFGGDPSVVGSTVELGDARFDVVGVLPPRFLFPSRLAGSPELVTVMEPVPPGDEGGTFYPVVRLEPGVTPEQAQRELDVVAAALAREGLVDSGTLPSLGPVRQALYAVASPIARLLLTASAFVLLLGCANLANLLQVRGRRREVETGIRSALGAGGTRIVRPLILEALLIAIAGAGVAVLLTRATFGSLLAQVPQVAYGAADVGVDARVAFFTLALGLLAGLAFSVLPAWRSTRVDVQSLIRQGGGWGASRRRVLGRGAVAVQVAAAVVLAFGAALTGRALVSLLTMPLGFEPGDVALIDVRPGTERPDVRSFYRGAVDALARRGDVVAAGATGSVPLVSPRPWAAIRAEDGDAVLAGAVQTLPGYLSAAGIRLLRGRDLTWDDVDADAPVAVLSVAAAARLLPGIDPLGARFTDDRGRTATVVGVAGDALQIVQSESMDFPAPVYVVAGPETRRLTLVARVRGGGAADLEALRADVAALAPDRIVDVSWWQDSIDGLTTFQNPRFQTLVLVSFALLALLLTGVGVYGVVAYLVASRLRELGIRMALGSSRPALVGLVVRQSLAPVLGGLVVGLVATRLLATLAEAQLYEVDTSDPVTLVGAVGTVLGAALVAALVPARRASRIAPAIVQRAE